MSNSIWFTWETQRRNKELADAFASKFCCFDYSNYPRLIRYAVSAFLTLSALIKYRPTIIFSQCPSLFLCLLIRFLRPLKKFLWVIDAHNAIFDYLTSSRPTVRFIAQTCISNANFVFATNKGMADELYDYTENTIILPDRLPEFNLTADSDEGIYISLTRPLITLISSFASDEPIELFLQAAAHLDRPFTLYVTGRLTKAEALLGYASHKIIFTDFLPQDEYDNLLRNSDLVVDLTSRENCLVCGAYEALALNRPMILSHSVCLQETFGIAAIYASNTVSSYSQALMDFLDKPEHYRSLVTIQRQAFVEKWNKSFKSAKEQLGIVCNN
ncbi:MAG: glycosyltransferase [Deltaproteobacteria bacterium]|nr:glycosyltransferase [Deltaproteobacteria bacterium]